MNDLLFFCTAKIKDKMGNLLKYLGVFIVLAGVLLLAIPAFIEGGTSNGTLASGGFLMVIGLIVHIVLNKYAKP